MAQPFLKTLLHLPLEEKIYNGAVIVGCTSVFFPWISGQWLGGSEVQYSGFGFYTGLIGTAIFLIQIAALLITIIPLTGGPILVPKQRKQIVRIVLSSVAAVLTLCALSVLLNVTLEFSRMELRFGILLNLIANGVALLYAGLGLQEENRREVQELFHQLRDE